MAGNHQSPHPTGPEPLNLRNAPGLCRCHPGPCLNGQDQQPKKLCAVQLAHTLLRQPPEEPVWQDSPLQDGQNPGPSHNQRADDARGQTA